MTVFISGTGTGVGKTWLTRGLARALARAGRDVAALKPIETGCDPEPRDALALERACMRPGLARAAGFYRARAALSPLAASMEGEAAPDLDAIALAVRAHAAALTLVEGAGGVLVPLDETRDMLDFARALDARIVLVGLDRLGTLSHVLTAAAAVEARGLELAAVALTRLEPCDASARTNANILRARLAAPVVSFAEVDDDDDALADAAAPIARAVFGLPLTRTRRAP